MKDGVEKSVVGVTYVEAPPPSELRDVVHCYWQMRTEKELEADFTLLAIPDACVNILFDQLDTRIAGVTALHTTHTELNLGRAFDFAGIQLFPGVWQGDPDGTVDHYVGEPYQGELPLVAVSQASAPLDFDAKAPIFTGFVNALCNDGVVARNPVTAAILTNLDDIQSVADMASVAALSARQLQRTLKASTGFSPHDLLKVLRVQRAFHQDYMLSFADQSHYTHSFRNVTGYTPGRFEKTFRI